MLLFSFSLQVCSSGDTWRADSVECTLPRALIPSSLHFLTCTCVYGTYLCVQQTPEDIWGVTKGARHNVIRQKREVLSWDAWTESYLLKKKKEGGDLSLHSLSSPSFSSCHSCWQSLIVLDKLMKSNAEEATGSLHLPKCMSVCTYLPVPMSGRLVSSGSQSTRWWDSKRVMRSLSIPSGQRPFCRREVVMNINYSHI